MGRPAILTIDDDPAVLHAVERDLRRRYSDRFRILRASSGQQALDVLGKLNLRSDPVALLLADHRMPEMTGVEFLARASKVAPDAKRVLLTAYADTDVAIRAINEVHLHHYLLKPWDPPEQQLYPVLDDLIEEWLEAYTPPFWGLRLVGTRWSPEAYELREFLARQHVPYQWHDVELRDRNPETASLLASLGEGEYPAAILPNGEALRRPSISELAARIGLQTQAGAQFYDLAIIGGGPAGLAAAVYGASEGLRTVLIERNAPGGQASLSARIENYLGFPSGLSGADLTRRAVAQARRFGVEILSPQQVTRMRVEGRYRFLDLADGAAVSSHAIMIATGVQWRSLNVPGIERFQGAGVYYGAGTTEAISCRDEEVYIVGGANSAGQAAMHFARYAKKVIMLVRGSSLAASMSQYLIDQIQGTPNIEVWTGATVCGVAGGERLEAIDIHCVSSGETSRYPAGAVFIFIGAEPGTEWLGGVVERDERGFILTGRDLMAGGRRPRGWTETRDPGMLETSVPGVFAVGDVRAGSVKRVASSVGEGSVAVAFVHQYLAGV